MNSWTERILERVRAHLGVEELSTCPRERLVGSIRHVAGETLKGSEVQAVVQAAREGHDAPSPVWDREEAIQTMVRWLRAEPSLGSASAYERARCELGYASTLGAFRQHWVAVRLQAEQEGVQLPKRGRPRRVNS